MSDAERIGVNRHFMWPVYVVLLPVVFFVAAKAFALGFFVVTVSNSPGGKIEFAGTVRSLPIGSSMFIVPVAISRDGEFVLRCNNSMKRDGYITPNLDTIVYVDIRNCDITSYRSFL